MVAKSFQFTILGAKNLYNRGGSETGRHKSNICVMISCEYQLHPGSPVWGETERFCEVHGKTFTSQCSHPFPSKFNHSNQKSIPVSDESPRRQQNNKWNAFSFQESNKFLPSTWRELGPWLRVNHCIRTDTNHSKSHQQKKKNAQKKAKSQTQKGVAHREKNNTKTQCKPC